MLLFLSTAVFADFYSPALAPSRIEINAPVRRKSKSILPPLSIYNRNAETLEIEMEVINQTSQNSESLPISEDWIKFEPKKFKLKQNESTFVTPILKIPKDVPNGHYRGLLKTKIIESEGKTRVLPAVASVLEFDVEGDESIFIKAKLFGANLIELCKNNLLVICFGLAVLFVISIMEKIVRRKSPMQKFREKKHERELQEIKKEMQNINTMPRSMPRSTSNLVVDLRSKNKITEEA